MTRDGHFVHNCKKLFQAVKNIKFILLFHDVYYIIERGGRKTPVDSSLQPITESPRPVPRTRQGSATSPKEPKLRSRDSSPR